MPGVAARTLVARMSPAARRRHPDLRRRRRARHNLLPLAHRQRVPLARTSIPRRPAPRRTRPLDHRAPGERPLRRDGRERRGRAALPLQRAHRRVRVRPGHHGEGADGVEGRVCVGDVCRCVSAWWEGRDGGLELSISY